MNTSTVRLSNRILNMLLQIGMETTMQLDVSAMNQEPVMIFITWETEKLSLNLQKIKEKIKEKLTIEENKNTLFYSEALQEINTILAQLTANG